MNSMNLTPLKVLHEDLVYVIECGAMTLTGEGKTEFSLAIDKLRGLADTPWDNEALLDALEAARRAYRNADSEHSDDHRFDPVVDVRRRVRNTIALLMNQKPIYNYAAFILT